jgi:hypothetical protein
MLDVRRGIILNVFFMLHIMRAEGFRKRVELVASFIGGAETWLL